MKSLVLPSRFSKGPGGKVVILQITAATFRSRFEGFELLAAAGFEGFNRIPWLTHICHSAA
jgi:hypothetical protein